MSEPSPREQAKKQIEDALKRAAALLAGDGRTLKVCVSTGDKRCTATVQVPQRKVNRDDCSDVPDPIRGESFAVRRVYCFIRSRRQLAGGQLLRLGPTEIMEAIQEEESKKPRDRSLSIRSVFRALKILRDDCGLVYPKGDLGYFLGERQPSLPIYGLAVDSLPTDQKKG